MRIEKTKPYIKVTQKDEHLYAWQFHMGEGKNPSVISPKNYTLKSDALRRAKAFSQKLKEKFGTGCEIKECYS